MKIVNTIFVKLTSRLISYCFLYFNVLLLCFILLFSASGPEKDSYEQDGVLLTGT